MAGNDRRVRVLERRLGRRTALQALLDDIAKNGRRIGNRSPPQEIGPPMSWDDLNAMLNDFASQPAEDLEMKT